MADVGYKTRGIVLHTMPHGESGHIVYMYTEAFGRISYYVNSGRRGVAVVGGSKVMLHPLTVLEYVGVKGSGSFHRIKEAKRALVSSTIFTDIYKSTISLYMAELIYKVIKEDEANPFMFDFLYNSVKIFDLMEEGKINFHLYFTLQLTKYLGFFPSNNYEDEFYFDMKSGGFLLIRPTHAFHCERYDSFLLNEVMHADIASLPNLKSSGKHRSELLGKIIEYIGIHHDTSYKIRSLEYLQEIF